MVDKADIIEQYELQLSDAMEWAHKKGVPYSKILGMTLIQCGFLVLKAEAESFLRGTDGH